MPKNATSNPSLLRKPLIALDKILRGETTSTTALKDGQVNLPTGSLTLLLVGLAMVYGFCIGIFAFLNPPKDGLAWAQVLSTTLKMPMLFVLTLVVTFPSLYVFNTLVGSRLTITPLVNLMAASMGVTLATLASFGPIVAFFSITTTSSAFVILLNVLACAVAGALGLIFLLQTLNRLTLALDKAVLHRIHSVAQRMSEDDTLPPGKPPLPASIPGALDTPDGHVLAGQTKRVFQCWILVFGLVGSQMSWVLRPFFGSPTRDFAIFATRESNFFQAVWQLIKSLFS
jgi:hypothetical protein